MFKTTIKKSILLVIMMMSVYATCMASQVVNTEKAYMGKYLDSTEEYVLYVDDRNIKYLEYENGQQVLDYWVNVKLTDSGRDKLIENAIKNGYDMSKVNGIRNVIIHISFDLTNRKENVLKMYSIDDYGKLLEAIEKESGYHSMKEGSAQYWWNNCVIQYCAKSLRDNKADLCENGVIIFK